jgi:predicted transposase/invertase (TIGR01784 family)
MEPNELSSEPIRPDTVILLEAPHIILHMEFQTRTDEEIPFRMTDYWVRIRRKHANKKIHQTVIYLKRTNSPLAYQTSYVSEQMIHNFNVIRLWEQPTEIFQQYLGLLPLAVLTKDDPTETLKAVAQQIDNISDPKVKSNLAAATYITSGLVLNKEVIQRLLRSEIMKESVTYQEILLEGETKGKAEGILEGEAKGKLEGKAEGMLEERIQIARNMLHSGISIDMIAQFTGLSPEQIERLR